jgi:hypothetical protein
MAALAAAAMAAVTIKPEKRLPMTISFCLATLLRVTSAANLSPYHIAANSFGNFKFKSALESISCCTPLIPSFTDHTDRRFLVTAAP